MKAQLHKMLVSSMKAKRDKALLTLQLLANNPAGIGDHSTEDFYNNAEDALAALTDADDQLETLCKYSEGFEELRETE